jgi:F420-non-reducing hydrogenase iron-sulfur subunit
MILRSFENGADGVMVVGCLEGDCHFQVGNLRARKRVERVARLLDQTGIDAERVRMVNLSAGEGAKFVAFANEMVEHIAALGPSPINLVRSGEPPPIVPEPEKHNAGEQA